jgi:hypothetical protein
MMTRRDALKLAAVVPFALPEIIKGEKEIVQVRVQRRPTIFVVVVGPPKTGKLTMALCAASQVGAGPRSAAVVDARWWTANWECAIGRCRSGRIQCGKNHVI